MLKQEYKEKDTTTLEDAIKICMKALTKTLDVKLSADKSKLFYIDRLKLISLFQAVVFSLVELATLKREGDKTVISILPHDEVDKYVQQQLQRDADKEKQEAATTATA